MRFFSLSLRQIVFFSLTFFLALSSCVAAGDTNPSAIPPTNISNTTPDTPGVKRTPGAVILVKFKPDTTEQAIQAIHRGIGAVIVKKFHSIGVQQLQLPSDIPIENAIDYYRAKPEVVYVEADRTVTIDNNGSK